MIIVLLACALMVASFGTEARSLAANGDRWTAAVSVLIAIGFAILGVAACL